MTKITKPVARFAPDVDLGRAIIAQDYKYSPLSPQYLKREQDLRIVLAIKKATSSVFFHQWASDQEEALQDGRDLDLQSLYELLVREDCVVEREILREVIECRNVVSALLTMVSVEANDHGDDDVYGFGDEDIE